MATPNNAQHKIHERILSLFAQQTSPKVLNELLQAADQGKLHLGGEQRTISVVFIDMRGYTTLAENLHPKDVMEIINVYIGIIGDTLINYGGTLTQYGGDQVMAVFNAPLNQPDHAERAVRSAIVAIQSVAQFNRSPAARTLPALAVFGAGINTGMAIVGNVGTEQRHTYTAIGDVVNVAARLCDQADPRTIYLSKNTLSQDLGELSQITEPLGQFYLKGRIEPLDVHRITL